MLSGDVSADAFGLYLQIYPSSPLNASRMMKIAMSVHESLEVQETHLVGVASSGVPRVESIGDGVYIVCISGSNRSGNLGRVLRHGLWQPRVYFRYRRESVSVIAAHNVWVLPLCWQLSRKTGAKLVYNAHELETESIAMRGLKKKIAKLIEARFIKDCRLVSVVNHSIADWYTQTYGINYPIVVGNVPVDRPACVRLRERLGITPDEMLYIHTGHLVDGRHIPLILSAFRNSQHHVVFLGDGPYRTQVVEASKASTNVHWHPPVHPEQVVSYVREADVGLCLIEHQLDLSDRLSSPNKLLESLAANIPPLCSDLIEARKLLGSLADKWILDDPQRQLRPALDRITKSDVRAFRETWKGTLLWHDEVAPLKKAYAKLAHSSRRN